MDRLEDTGFATAIGPDEGRKSAEIDRRVRVVFKILQLDLLDHGKRPGILKRGKG
jgi:hypothetical protein